MKFIAKIKQYGFLNSIKRMLKKLAKNIGIHVESYYFMKTYLDQSFITHKMQEFDYTNAKELSYSDFLKGDLSYFNAEKLNVIKDRYKTEKYHALGIIENDFLVYSCWINGKMLEYPALFKKQENLKTHEALLQDAFCHPSFRRKGYHTKMGIYRLHKMIEMGYTSAVVFVLTDNVPSYKALLKLGFKIEKKVFYLRFFSKSYMVKTIN